MNRTVQHRTEQAALFHIVDQRRDGAVNGGGVRRELFVDRFVLVPVWKGTA